MSKSTITTSLLISLCSVVAPALVLANETAPQTPPAVDNDLELADLELADLELAIGTTNPAALTEVGDDPLPLSRDGEETQLRSFTVEGEDRISISFERPRIDLDLDARGAPGLGWKNSWDKVDVFPTVCAQSALTASQFTGRPWLREYAQDQVVVFNPQAPDLASWKLTVIDSRGKPAVVFAGEGTPPAQLAWDGRRTGGQPAWPGLIYSFVLETVDPAGNQRTTAGRGFDLPAYRLTGKDENVLVFSGKEIGQKNHRSRGSTLSDLPLISETASWLNQASGLTAPIEIRTTARTTEQAQALAARVQQALAPLVCGDPARLVTKTLVISDAPDQGVVEVACRP